MAERPGLSDPSHVGDGEPCGTVTKRQLGQGVERRPCRSGVSGASHHIAHAVNRCPRLPKNRRRGGQRGDSGAETLSSPWGASPTTQMVGTKEEVFLAHPYGTSPRAFYGQYVSRGGGGWSRPDVGGVYPVAASPHHPDRDRLEHELQIANNMVQGSRGKDATAADDFRVRHSQVHCARPTLSRAPMPAMCSFGP